MFFTRALLTDERYCDKIFVIMKTPSSPPIKETLLLAILVLGLIFIISAMM